MRDEECVDFLRWALPRLRLRWAGFRRVRGPVCKRIGRRLRGLGLGGLASYRRHLEARAEEWPVLDSLCRVTISRFYRDRRVFERIETQVLPHVARLAIGRGEDTIRCWSAGCASGEEAYTLSILWGLRVGSDFPGLRLHLVATDADDGLLERARRGCYGASSLRELPTDLRQRAFSDAGGVFRVRDEFRDGLEFRLQDIREDQPDGIFHLVLCRNLAFTYFDEVLQAQILEAIARRLLPGGILVVGRHERPPAGAALTPRERHTGIYVRR